MLFYSNKMEKFWILIFVSFLAINSLDKAESVKVKLEQTPLKTFDEIFGEGWWDKGEAEDLKTPAPTNFGQNVHHQIDRQNTQIGQIEPNSTDQNPPLTESDHSGQIEPNSTDQNSPLTESDHSESAKNEEEHKEITSNENIAEDEQKRKIIDKFNAIKDEFKQKGKYSAKDWNKIEVEIAKHLKVNRNEIYEWKKEFCITQRNPKNDQKNLIEKFDQMKADLKRDGIKNSYPNQINETVAKELGLSFVTIYKWKRKLGQTRTNYSDDEKLKIVKELMRIKSEHSGEDKKSCKEIDKEIAERFGVNVRTINQWKKAFGLSQRKPKHSEQKELLMKRYYEIKAKNPKISDEEIAKILKIGRATLIRWKRQFKRHQFHPNSVDVHSVEENDG